MADLVTHLCTVLLPGAFVRSRFVPIAALGVLLPDLSARAVPVAIGSAIEAGLPLPLEAVWPWSAFHEPLGVVLVATGLSLLFVERDRRGVWRALVLGGAAHLCLDLLQDHHGRGYALLAPFSTLTFELGWIGSEATVAWAPALALLTAIAWTVRFWRARQQPATSPR